MSKEYPSQTAWLRSLDDKSEQDCYKENRPIILGANILENVAIAARPYCKCWDCPTCGARNAKRWIARIIHGCNTMDTVNGWHMFTLTAHEKWRGNRSVPNLRKGWKKLYNRIRRKYGVNYFAKVWEMHDDDTYHLHGLIDCVIPNKWLKDNARACGMGYQVDIHPVDNAGQVAGYIAKYFMKSQTMIEEVSDWYPNLRRIEVSRNWVKLPDLKDPNWSWRIADSENFADYWVSTKKAMGWDVIDNRKTEEKSSAFE